MLTHLVWLSGWEDSGSYTRDVGRWCCRNIFDGEYKFLCVWLWEACMDF